jgi:hypothetical protein
MLWISLLQNTIEPMPERPKYRENQCSFYNTISKKRSKTLITYRYVIIQLGMMTFCIQNHYRTAKTTLVKTCIC